MMGIDVGITISYLEAAILVVVVLVPCPNTLESGACVHEGILSRWAYATETIAPSAELMMRIEMPPVSQFPQN